MLHLDSNNPAHINCLLTSCHKLNQSVLVTKIVMAAEHDNYRTLFWLKY